jgi:hypothetical protein
MTTPLGTACVKKDEFQQQTNKTRKQEGYLG